MLAMTGIFSRIRLTATSIGSGDGVHVGVGVEVVVAVGDAVSVAVGDGVMVGVSVGMGVSVQLMAVCVSRHAISNSTVASTSASERVRVGVQDGV